VFHQAGPHHPGFLALKRDSSHGTLTLDLASGGIFALAAVWRSGLRRTDCCANGCAQLVSCEIGQPALGREAQKHDGGERRAERHDQNQPLPPAHQADRQERWAGRWTWLAQKGPRQRENHQAITRFGARVAKLRKVRDKNAPLLKRGVERVGEPLFKPYQKGIGTHY
jgi:hypothetical protein